ncbi:acylneuraminate cytidylyltransferase [Pedobacter hiemivivus]|uniref:Acylneuraminate cytidylyltransferase n=1 Tax=Pedobacter hiemivivus TaxID=2530454 RepID=A0A4U1G0E1_9SPHI|nr:glycosyltransferase family protein [Pedobacter hiemivivus]TKC56945.1 acylneuraminate cytidylyltransferase [Pedobacter hiemivivus]
MRIAIITQARINSSRLPNKIFLEAAGKSFLSYHIERLKETTVPIIVATTDDGSELPIVEFCLKNNIDCFRGSEMNVLKRFYDCAVHNDIEVIVRVTSDCPLIDAELVKQGIDRYLSFSDDKLYFSNTLDRTFPRGADFEIFSIAQLKNAYENAYDELDAEHVTPYIWKNKSGEVNIFQLKQSADYSNYRLTLDTQEDFELIKLLIEEYKADKLSMKSICEIMDQNPSLAKINSHIEQKKA